MVDNGALYSKIGFAEPFSLSHLVFPQCQGGLCSFHDAFYSCIFWQYGTGYHAREPLLIFYSVVINSVSLDKNVLDALHLLLYGSFSLVIGINVSLQSNIMIIVGNAMYITEANVYILHLSLINLYYHLFLPLNIFCIALPILTSSAATTASSMPWSAVKTSYTDLITSFAATGSFMISSYFFIETLYVLSVSKNISVMKSNISLLADPQQLYSVL